jgi:hypothetical protein
MSDSGKCPMGNNPWIATILVLGFVLILLIRKLGIF